MDKPIQNGPLDLHTHTTSSDGRLSPDNLVALAKERGLGGIAVTDHDTVLGLPEALAAGDKHDLLVIPGIELTADSPRSEVHLLGYWIDHHHPRLCQRMAEVAGARVTRAKEMVRKLHEQGFNVSWETITQIAGPSGFVGRSHIFRAMVEEGLVPVENKNAVFREYLGKNGLAYVSHDYLPWEEAMELILEAGGVPVLAHPGRMEDALELLPVLVEAGLMGLEVYYPTHASAEVSRYRGMAERYHLIPTGGTDFHGDTSGAQAPLGSCSAPPGTAAKLLAAAGKGKEN